MIRESKAEDLPAILTLWMESTIHAHPFIEERYWRESESVVRDVYLPAAQNLGLGRRRRAQRFCQRH